MIFVTLGTQDKSFKRLLNEIDRCIENNIIKEKVIVQSGYTKYKSKNMKIIDFITKEKFDKYMNECSLLITHGGAGSILTGMRYNKKVIAVPRIKKYKEHTNDHQIQIVEELDKKGYILKCDNLKNLEDIIIKSKKFTPKKYLENNNKILEVISDYITKSNNHNKSFLILGLLILIIFIILIIIF